MYKIKDFSGLKFGELTVIERADNTPAGSTRWKCQCSCGNYNLVTGGDLKRGHSVSCGCKRIEAITIKRTIHGHSTKLKHTSEYRTWASMKSRCNNKNATGYKHYGGRGIKYDPRWDIFANFIEDMGFKPSVFHSIDRIDYDGNYTKENCRWATDTEQARNKSSNNYMDYKGVRYPTISDLAEAYNLNEDRIRSRLALGWNINQCVERPIRYRAKREIRC